jgi:putative lipoprotein
MLYLDLDSLLNRRASPYWPVSMRTPPPAVTGTLTYRDRAALPPGAVVRVRLVEMSLPEAPARTIAEQIITRPGQPPIDFAVPFNPSAINPRHIYQIDVHVTAGRRLHATNTRQYPVITNGNPFRNIQVVLVPVEEHGVPGSAGPLAH